MPTPGRRLVGSHLRQAGNDVIQGHAELTPKKSVLLLQDLDVVVEAARMSAWVGSCCTDGRLMMFRARLA